MIPLFIVIAIFYVMFGGLLAAMMINEANRFDWRLIPILLILGPLAWVVGICGLIMMLIHYVEKK